MELKQIAELAKEYDGFEESTDLISFDGFKRFFRLHLLNLSKKTEIQEMRSRLKSVVSSMTMGEKKKFQHGHFDIGDFAMDANEEATLMEHLSSLFHMMDKDENPRPGFVTHEEVEEVRCVSACMVVGLSGCLHIHIHMHIPENICL